MTGGLIAAIRTLTILPAPGREAGRMSSALPWFPLVGALLGGAIYGLAAGVEALSGGWPGGAAAAALAGGVVITGALHLDGLADWADGFGGGRDREKILDIMKDSSTGVFGAVALVLVLLIKWVSISRLSASGNLFWFAAACVISRTAMVELAVWLPYARLEGGTGSEIVEGARSAHRAGAVFIALSVLLVLGGPAGALSLAGGWIACRGYGLWCRRRVGGITGDLLGAGGELIEALMLSVFALAGPELVRYAVWGRWPGF